MARERRKRLAVELDEELDSSMRLAAKKSWMNVSTFIHRAIAEKIVRDFGQKALFETIEE